LLAVVSCESGIVESHFELIFREIMGKHI